jgi:hypothetical protein
VYQRAHRLVVDAQHDPRRDHDVDDDRYDDHVQR